MTFKKSCRFRNVGDNFEWAFIGVYGPNVYRDKRLMWEEVFIVGGICHGV